MSQAEGVWSAADHAVVCEVALVCQRNLVRALRDPRQVASLHKQRVSAWMKCQRYVLPVAEFGSEEDLDTARDVVLKLGGYLGEPTGQEETDAYALSLSLADALLLFAPRVEGWVRRRYPVAIRGWLIEGRIALWALIDDLDALVAQVVPVLPAPFSPLVPGEIHQASLWTASVHEREEEAS
jgi:hypothetical protein